MTGINQSEGAARRADVDRLPEAVQHQYLTIKQRVQLFLFYRVTVLLRNFRGNSGDLITRVFPCQRGCEPLARPSKTRHGCARMRCFYPSSQQSSGLGRENP
jgi:hypothetical protein